MAAARAGVLRPGSAWTPPAYERRASRESRMAVESQFRSGAAGGALTDATREDAMRLTGLIHAVEAHAEGEPARVIVGGVVDVPGATMFEKKLYLERERDSLRRL